MRVRAPQLTADKVIDDNFRDLFNAASVAIGFVVDRWQQTNVAAGQTNVVLPLGGTADNTQVTMPVAGNVIGITVASNAARTAGALTVQPTINGTVTTGLSAILDGTNTQFHAATNQSSMNSFRALQRIGVIITTTAAWAPATADIVVHVYVLL